MNPQLRKLIDTGIPVTKAQFHAAVDNADRIPENYFSNESLVPSRRADMWLTSAGLVCRQKNVLKEDRYFFVPLATIIFINFARQDESEAHAADPIISAVIAASSSTTDYQLDDVAASSSATTNTEVTIKKRGRPFKNKNEN